MGPGRALRMYHHCLCDPIEMKLPHVRIPTLVLRGNHDYVADLQWCEQVVRLLPDASLDTIPNAGHVAHFTRPAETARQVDAFLRHVV
jgi:2-hydroxy-6-oxonona-2,4-dienedioate hydrolase